MAEASYPMEIAKISFLHKQGTKEYFLTLVATADGRAIVIRRWGPKGKTGQIKVKTFLTTAEAETEFFAEQDLRLSRTKGYDVTDSKTLQAERASDLPLMIGRFVYPKMGSAGILHLDPDIDVSDIREPDNTLDEEGNFVGHTPRRVDPDIVAKAEKELKEKALDAMRSNSKFGMF